MLEYQQIYVRCVDTLEVTFELKRRITKVFFNKSSLLEKDLLFCSFQHCLTWKLYKYKEDNNHK